MELKYTTNMGTQQNDIIIIFIAKLYTCLNVSFTTYVHVPVAVTNHDP